MSAQTTAGEGMRLRAQAGTRPTLAFPRRNNAHMHTPLPRPGSRLALGITGGCQGWMVDSKPASAGPARVGSNVVPRSAPQAALAGALQTGPFLVQVIQLHVNPHTCEWWPSTPET